MQRLEVSDAVRPLAVVRRQRVKPLDTTASPTVYSHGYIIRIQIFLVVTLRHGVGGSLRRRVTGKSFLVKPYRW